MVWKLLLFLCCWYSLVSVPFNAMVKFCCKNRNKSLKTVPGRNVEFW